MILLTVLILMVLDTLYLKLSEKQYNFNSFTTKYSIIVGNIKDEIGIYLL